MQVALVRFEKISRNYYFSIPTNLEINVDNLVVVETVIGFELGRVLKITTEDKLNFNDALKPIVRVATEEDLMINENNESESLNITVKAKELVKKHNLNMEILKSMYTLDRMRLVIYFKADERIDFRDLVKELSSIYQTRIELRQLGPRDVAKMIGGIGPCGRVLCCQSFIGEFEPVTINMAKNQELSLNPTTISGVCGRLLCCLKFEDGVYEELRKIMPDLNDVINTTKGKGKVIDLNFIKSQIKVQYFDNEYHAEWLSYREINGKD